MNKTAPSQSRLRAKVSETRGNLVGVGRLTKETVQDKLHDLKDRASEDYENGKEKLLEFGEGMVRRVRNAPVKSVLIAAGVGLALGFIWRRI